MGSKNRDFAVETTGKGAIPEGTGALSGPHTYRDAQKRAQASGGRVVALPGAQRPSGYRGGHRSE